MDLTTLQSLGTMGLLAGAIVAGAKRAGLDDKYSPLATLLMGAAFGMLYQFAGLAPHFAQATAAGQYAGAALLGLFSAASWEGLTNAATSTFTTKQP